MIYAQITVWAIVFLLGGFALALLGAPLWVVLWVVLVVGFWCAMLLT